MNDDYTRALLLNEDYARALLFIESWADILDTEFDDPSECQETIFLVVDQMRLFLEEA